jgi:DNA-binding MarR family transcriptional regulator
MLFLMARDDSDLSLELLGALVPLLRLVQASRTLSPGKIGALREVSARGRATAGELATSIGVSQQAVSLAANELAAAGYLERRPDEHDKRRVWFHLTPAGAAKLEAESQIGRAALQARVDAALTPADRAVLESALPVLTKIAEGPADE